VLVRGRLATFVKPWGAGAIVRYDDAPAHPKVVPLERLDQVIVQLQDAVAEPAALATRTTKRCVPTDSPE
jgi:hypothetical protein